MSDDSGQEEEKSVRLQTPPGIHDALPKDHEYMTFIKKVVRHRARQAGFKRITTPIVEYAELFDHACGKDTELTSKEMYRFEDKNGHELTLKPDGTVGVVRAYVQHNMNTWAQPVELYYIEPHFRWEQPRKGRYRMFWQFGFELIGEGDPALDVQCIQLAYKIFDDLGLGDLFELRINNIGSSKSREKYIEQLKDHYVGKERNLCFDCQDRLEDNPLHLLACEEEDCQILAQLAPKFADYRSKEDVAHHESVKTYLEELEIEFSEMESMVRNTDYYTQTVWEFWPKEGKQAVGGGGRYDELVEHMGGEPTPGVGFSCGMDRLIMHMKSNNIEVPSKDNVHIVVAQLGDLAKKKCLPLIEELRDEGVKTVGSLGKGSIKSQLALAMKHGAPYMLLLGSTEVREETIIIRDMAKGQQRHVPMKDVVKEVIKLIGKENLDKYSPGEVQINKDS